MPDPARRRAIVVGGSMSGLLSGLLLRRAGWTVDIYERVDSELSGRGAGIVAQPELIERLRALGLKTDALGVAHHHTQDPRCAGPPDTTRSNARRCSPPGSAPTACCAMPFRPSTITAAAGLPNLPRRMRMSVRGAFFRWRKHRGRPAGGRRRHPLDRSPAMPARCDAALCRLFRLARADRGKRDFPPDVHRELFESMSFGLPPGEQFLGYPVAGPDNDLRPGKRRYNVVWYRPADETPSCNGCSPTKAA